MATNIIGLATTSGLKVVEDTDCNATSEANVNSGAATIYGIRIDNRANPSTVVFLKLWDATAPTVGTTAPDAVFPCGGGKVFTALCTDGDAFGTGLSFACVTDGGGTAGTTSPTNDVIVRMVIA